MKAAAPYLPRRDLLFSAVAAAMVPLVVAGALLLHLPLARVWVGLGGVGLLGIAFNCLVTRITLFPYDRILSAYSEDGITWAKDRGVRIDVGGLHRSCQVYSPEVVATEAGFRMYYRAGGYDSIIASAHSEDGLSWVEEPGIRVAANQGLRKVGDPEVLRLSPDLWRMYFAGYDGTFWRIYCSDSGQGLCWQERRLCIDLSRATSLNQVSNPKIVRERTGFRIYFLCFGGAETTIYTAESDDGNTWRSIRPCEGYGVPGYQVSNICIGTNEEGLYRLYFAEHPNSTVIGSMIVSAVSPDGVHWTREAGSRVAPGGPNDQFRSFCPDVVRIGSKWRMYYGGLGRHFLSPYTIYKYKKG